MNVFQHIQHTHRPGVHYTCDHAHARMAWQTCTADIHITFRLALAQHHDGTHSFLVAVPGHKVGEPSTSMRRNRHGTAGMPLPLVTVGG